MQQAPEKPQAKAQENHHQDAHAYQPTVWAAVLTTSAKVCYGLSAASALATVGVWNRSRVRMPFGKQSGKKFVFKAPPKAAKPSKQYARQTYRLSALVGACAPTFAAAGKALDYASARVAKADYAAWEKNQAKKARSFARFFSR